MSDFRSGDRNGNNGEDALYRLLPSVGDLLLDSAFVTMSAAHSRALVADAARTVLSRLRQQISTGEHSASTLPPELQRIGDLVAAEIDAQLRPSLVRVVNATGMLLHTNLGRAPLSRAALEQIVQTASGYSNLELNLETGQRGRRDDHVEPLLLKFLAAQTGRSEESVARTHGAVVVNNCAAATFLALNSLAEGGEVVVSRGELVEIGGGFRIPDILRKSGASLREVGTTNRTRIADYEAALHGGTRLILRVHQSNFKIEGFTERPMLEQLVTLGEREKVPVFEDQGTGLMLSLETLDGLAESSFVESFRAGVPLIAASGDKLLGGPQCGLLVGRTELIEPIRRNPLLRALSSRQAHVCCARGHAARVRGWTGKRYTRRAHAADPCWRCACALRTDAGGTRAIALRGGGSRVKKRDRGRHHARSLARQLCRFLAARDAFLHQLLPLCLRRAKPAVMCRVQNDRVLLDLRTVFPEQDAELIEVLKQVATEHRT